MSDDVLYPHQTIHRLITRISAQANVYKTIFFPQSSNPNLPISYFLSILLFTLHIYLSPNHQSTTLSAGPVNHFHYYYSPSRHARILLQCEVEFWLTEEARTLSEGRQTPMFKLKDSNFK